MSENAGGKDKKETGTQSDLRDSGADIGKRVKEHRKLRGFTQESLAIASGVPYTTLTKIESGRIKNPSLQAITKLAKALDASLDDFILSETLRGGGVMKRIHQDILKTLQPGDTMYITGVDESRFLAADQQQISSFIKTIGKIGLHQKLISCEGNKKGFVEDFIEYRAIPMEYFNDNPMYVYGTKVAAVIWGPPLQAVILNNSVLADSYRKQFLFMWKNAEKILIITDVR